MAALASAGQFHPPAFVFDLALDYYLSPELPGFAGTIKATYPPPPIPLLHMQDWKQFF